MSATEPGFLAGETFGGYLVSLVYFVGLRRATAARRARRLCGLRIVDVSRSHP